MSNAFFPGTIENIFVIKFVRRIPMSCAWDGKTKSYLQTHQWEKDEEKQSYVAREKMFILSCFRICSVQQLVNRFASKINKIQCIVNESSNS